MKTDAETVLEILYEGLTPEQILRLMAELGIFNAKGKRVVQELIAKDWEDELA